MITIILLTTTTTTTTRTTATTKAATMPVIKHFFSPTIRCVYLHIVFLPRQARRQGALVDSCLLFLGCTPCLHAAKQPTETRTT
jgi:hypothetical protein